MSPPQPFCELHGRIEVTWGSMSGDQDWMPSHCGVSKDFSPLSEALPFREKTCCEVR